MVYMVLSNRKRPGSLSVFQNDRLYRKSLPACMLIKKQKSVEMGSAEYIWEMAFNFLYLVTWREAKYGNPYSELVRCIYPIQKCTHTAVNTHIMNTQWAAIVCSDVQWRWFSKKNNGPTSADDITPQIITDCGNLTLDFKQLGLWASPTFHQTLGPWFPNKIYKTSPWLCSLVNQTERLFWRLRKPLQVFWVD